jgi:PHD/YefM family antitoxin component YafN of YafNO toxin-antitoxin module
MSDVQPLSVFKRDTAKVLANLEKTGKPVTLTVNGKAEIVVQDTAAYQLLLDLAAIAGRAEMAAFLDESRKDADASRILPAKEFLESLGRKT